MSAFHHSGHKKLMTAFDPLRSLASQRIIVSMRLRDYFAGERFRLRSSLSTRTVAERVNQAAGSTLWPFSTGVVGGIRSGHIRLRYRSSPFEYNAKPVLSGRLQEVPRGSSLDLRYRAPVWVYGFYIVWYLFLAFLIFGLVANGWFPEVTDSEKAQVAATIALLLVAPVGLHMFGTRNAEEELSDLLDFLAQHAEASR